DYHHVYYHQGGRHRSVQHLFHSAVHSQERGCRVTIHLHGKACDGPRSAFSTRDLPNS
ncbi:hypothetical protein M9458_022066, partial [Cirrhinus mrigala]